MARTGCRVVAKGTGDLREQMGRDSRRTRNGLGPRRASVHNDWPELSLDVGPGAWCWVQRVNHTLGVGGSHGKGGPIQGNFWK